MNDQQQDTTRAASYLATQQRMDLRGFGATRTGKTRAGKLNCNPPNVQCGNRCIPPNWDCRLKGQGTNSDLSAHAQDLLGGVASLQRGRRDLVKGVVTANPELINRGRNSLVRGAVKIAPGDNLQAKKRLKDKIQKTSRPIVTVLTLGVIGFAAHSGLKKTWPGYAKGAGKDLDDAVRSAYNSVLDRTPLIAGRRAAIRATGESAAYRTTRQLLRGNQLATTTSAMAYSNPLRPGLAATVGTSADLRGSNTINNYDTLVKESRGTTNKDTWIQRGRELVYGATDKNKNSIYSTDASAYLLTKQFGLNPRDVLGSDSRSTRRVADRRELLKSNLTTRLNELSSAMQQDMQLRGMDADQYRARVIGPQVDAAVSGLPRGRTAATKQANDFLSRLLTTTNVVDSRKHATELIGKTEVHFNTVFNSLASNVNRNAASSDSPADEATLGFARFLATHDRGPAVRIVNNEHADLYLEGVFQKRVNGSSRPIEVTVGRAVRVAKAVGGRATDPDATQALEILRLQGGIRATYAQAPGKARPQQSLTAIARRLMASQGLSYAAALRQARAEVARRGDAAEVERLGKPCGASHIPKAHDCRKSGGQPAAKDSTDAQKRNAATIAAVVGGAVAITAAGSVAYNLKNLSDPTKSPLDPSPSIKDLVKTMKQEAGTKSASEAMGFYYTKKSGLKPGDVVYFRNDKDPAAHFGIYLGEGKDGKVRAVIANTKESRFSWADVVEVGATKPGIKTPQALMTPLVKAPDPQFKRNSDTSFSNKEVVKRAIRIAGTDYKFTLTRDNCEALANGIAYGVPQSEQLQRFRRATRAVVDVSVARGQRREAREAIYQGRAQGRSYTASEFVTFLQGRREFSSPAGKELAQQYAQYFKGERLDAEYAALRNLISPDELWSSIQAYGPAVRARAMADYLLIQRSLTEMDRVGSATSS
jgi:signal peptidase I